MTSHQYAPNPFRNGLTNGLINKAGRKRRTSDDLPLRIGDYVPVWQESFNPGYSNTSSSFGPPQWHREWREAVGMFKAWRPRDLLGVPLLLIIIWMVVLWWGEEAIFRRKVEDCAWDRWESWVCTTLLRRSRT